MEAATCFHGGLAAILSPVDMNKGGKRPFWVASLLTCFIALAGCRSSTPTPPKAEKVAQKKEKAAEKKVHDSEPDAEKLASAHTHYAAGVLHEINHESDAALKEYYQAAMIDSSDEDLSLRVSAKFIETKQLDKAIEVLNRRTSRPDATGAVFARLGAIYFEQGKTNEAVAANRTAIKRSPTLLAGYHNLFLIALQNKQSAEALRILDEAAAQANTDLDFLLPLSQFYVRLALQAADLKVAANAKARAVLDRAEKLNPDDPSDKLQLAEGYNAVGEYKKAAQVYLDLLKTLPDVPLVREKVRARLTDIYLRGDDRKQAAEQVQGIIRDDPTNPQAYYWLGELKLDQKEFQEAADALNRCILLSKDFEPAYYDLAVAQLNLNKPSDALATLEKARGKFKENFQMEFWSGTALMRQKAYKEALTHYTRAELLAMASDPKRLNELFYFEFGAAFERSGDYDQAEKYFQKSIDASPDFAEALNYLGYMWVERGKKLEEARGLIEKAVKLEPKNPAYLDSLAWVLFKLGQPEEALTNILKATEFSPEPDATIYDHLGDIYAALNQRDKAREAWQKSLSVEANEAVEKKLKEAPSK
jgi:tetratricopeptide (TPR) repeat protein